MNRRSFLKRFAAVAAGAVAVPTVAKKFKPNSAQRVILHGTHTPRYRWIFGHLSNPYNFDPPSKPSKYPEYEIGTRYCAPGGQIYRYVKMCKNEETQVC